MAKQGKNRGKAGPTSPSADVFGVGPVSELIKAAPDAVSAIAVTAARSSHGPVAKIVGQAKHHGIRVDIAEPGDLDRATGGGRHQGVVAHTRPYQYAELDTVLETQGGAAPLVLALDSVTDPRNLGAVARSAYLLGASGIIVARDRSAQVTAVATKASAGAVFHLPIAQVTNLSRALAELKEHGLWNCAIASADNATPLVELDGAMPLCLVLGSEGAGIRPQVAKQCDFFVEIPMAGAGVGSFNVSVAASIALYEVARQRHSK